ncbi:MAG: histidine kinase [Bacteroidales bacterium]|jgi:sensor histidine kinase YesM|nr:histidine kinase [Bacteroidales bacterium]
MNGNPILGTYRSKMLYATVWMFIACIRVLTGCFAAGLPFEYALVDSIVFCTLFAVCILPLWYPVRFNRWERRTRHFKFVAYGVLMCIYLMVCLPAGYLIMAIIASNDDIYVYFLYVSIWSNVLTGILSYTIAVLIYYLYISIEQLNEKATNEIRLNNLLKEGELNLLKSQINPHFLFNSLNSINSLIVTNSEKAQQMLVALSEYLRYTVLSTNRVYSRIEEEIENTDRYLSIEQLRFGGKLIYESDIAAECLQATIPAMLLQPLFENAIKHGVYESLQAVRIALEIKQENEFLRIKLSNDYDGHISVKKSSFTGLQNVRERLRLLYGNAAEIQTKATGGKFIVTVSISCTA